VNVAALLKSIIMLFVVLDPISVAPFYAAEASKLPSQIQRKKLLNTVLTSALAMLLAFAIVGDYLFHLLDVGINDFRVAAGIILLVYAVSSLFDIHIGGPREGVESAIVPLAVPMLAGPGSISTLLYIKYTEGYVIALLSATINILVSYPIFYYSGQIMKILGSYGLSLIEKFMSFIMAGFAISMIRVGISGL